MIVADVELAKAILNNTRQLQQDLIELLVVTTRQRLDCCIRHCVGRCTKAWLN